ncbi:MAG: ParB/RepB/Spo0J family partition protein [Ruminococcus sp.]|nr:ParB/RepB/Spo0J family partition protein [Ruminococcus sp.]MDY4909011.1 ParB/RepB/Spo0J family partition protein [Candidatus Fimenecus sp.]
MKQQRVKSTAEIYNIPQAMIVPNPNQPRKRFDYDELENLAQSIRENGILQPITVRKREDKKYELVSGERRLRAARLVGMVKIPSIVINIDDKNSAMFSIIENLQRQSLNFFEEAEAIEKLVGEYAMSREEVAQKLGLAPSTVSNKLRILRLPEEMRFELARAGLTESHARALLMLEDDNQRARALSIIVDRHLNVAESERMINQMINRNNRSRNPLRGIRDVRLFINTLNHAVDTIRRAGVEADAARSETEEYIEYVVRIPKSEQLRIALPGETDEAI